MNNDKLNSANLELIDIDPLTRGQLKVFESDKNLFLHGCAGTGKTYIACAQALKLLKAYPGKYKRVVLVKSVTTLRDEEIGFLKGTMEEKMEPFMFSFMHNFQKILKSKKQGEGRFDPPPRDEQS